MADRVLRRMGLAAAALLVLGACSAEPIKTKPPRSISGTVGPLGETPVGKGPDAPRVLSYCYSSQINDSQQVIDAAREACPGGRLHFHEEDVFWTSCPLLQPMRVTFLCYPANDAENSEAPAQE